MHQAIISAVSVAYGVGMGCVLERINSWIKDGDRVDPWWADRLLQVLVSVLWPLWIFVHGFVLLGRGYKWVVNRIQYREYYRQQRMERKKMEAQQRKREAEAKERERKAEEQRKREEHADKYL